MSKMPPITGTRPPIVAVVGHIDHGKSTLLDYIRKTNVVEGEAGGITQHLSAYEATHKNATGEHHITFLDTPGHEAFKMMRSRGLEIADVAILVVSSEEGAKPQTTEALKLIEEAKIPYIVAFTKIDKPGANIERAKLSMLENNVYLEGMGGEVPFVAISSKSGEGIPELLDLILLAAELEGLSADPNLGGTGLVIEAHVDPRRGNTATLIIKNGSIKSGEFVVCGGSLAPVRIMENYAGKATKNAGPGSPVRIVGFSVLPTVGDEFKIVESKKEAEEHIRVFAEQNKKAAVQNVSLTEEEEALRVILPLFIKTDVAGTGEAVMHELEKLPQHQNFEVRMMGRGVGNIAEGDVKLVSGGKTPGIIIGFNVKVEKEARDLSERLGVTVATFNIIYEVAQFLAEQIEKHRPRIRIEEIHGRARVIKFFSSQKNRVVVGGKVETGALKVGDEVKITRRDEEVGRGEITGLQAQKKDVKEVESGSEFGAMIKINIEPQGGDYIEVFEIIMK